jgi:lysophospholipase L1-like esterase
VRDGLLRGRAVPPFGAVTSPSQRDWLERQHAVLARAAADEDDVETRTFDPDLGWTRVNPDAPARGGPHARPPRPYGPEPREGALRMACFGDSFTYGAEVADRACWAHLLELALEDHRAEVLNFGVGGFGTDQALLRYRGEGRELGARVVLIGIMLENIGRNVNRYRPLWFPGSETCVTKPRFALEDGRLELVPNPLRTRAELVAAVEDGSVLTLTRQHEYWAERPALGPLARRSGLARVLAVRAAAAERDVRGLWTRTQGEPFQVTLALLEEFHREALEDGAEQAAVLLFPRREDLRALAAGDRYWQPALERLDRGAIPWLDLADALHAAGAAGTGIDALYTPGGHLSHQGNAVAARAIEAWLRPRLARLDD